MYKLLLLIAIIFSSNTYAKSYLCTGEAAAGITYSDSGRVKSFTADVSKMQWMVTNTSGNWVVKEVGLNAPLPLQCQSEYYCEIENGDFFWRDKNGYFEYYRRQPNFEKPNLVEVGIIGGRCIDI